MTTTYVLIHGTHSNAHHWAWAAQELSLLGHRAVSVDLPGHGLDAYIPDAYHHQDLAALDTEPTPIGKLTADDYADHVEDIVRRAHRNGPVVLVGHSQGGVTVSLVANRVPDLLHRIVYVSAFCCVDLPSMADYMMTPEAQTEELAAFYTLGHGAPAEGQDVSRINWRSTAPEDEEAFRNLNAHTFSPEQARAAFQFLQPDEPFSIPTTDARGHAETWGRIPRTYVRLTDDRLLSPALQDRWIAEADRLTPDNRFGVHSIDAPHLLPRDPELVRILSEAAGD